MAQRPQTPDCRVGSGSKDDQPADAKGRESLSAAVGAAGAEGGDDELTSNLRQALQEAVAERDRKTVESEALREKLTSAETDAEVHYAVSPKQSRIRTSGVEMQH